MGRRILILEDNDTFREFVGMVLKKQGHEILSAANIAQARQQLAALPPDDPLYLVIDVVLDGESGITFAQELVQNHANYRVLLISGFTDDVLMIQPEQIARIAFLRKPFTQESMVAALDKLAR